MQDLIAKIGSRTSRCGVIGLGYVGLPLLRAFHAAGFPVLVGHMSDSMPLGQAIGIDAAIAYSLVVIAVLMLPETKGRQMETGA